MDITLKNYRYCGQALLTYPKGFFLPVELSTPCHGDLISTNEVDLQVGRRHRRRVEFVVSFISIDRLLCLSYPYRFFYVSSTYTGLLCLPFLLLPSLQDGSCCLYDL